MKKTTFTSLLMLVTAGALVLSGCNSSSSKKKKTTSKVSSSEISTSQTPSVVNVESVELNQNDIYLQVGSTQTLKATIYPSNATNQNVSWSSSNTDIASVIDGTITAKTLGDAQVTVTTEDQNKTATCVVHVTNTTIYPDSVSLTYDELAMVVGEQRTLKATVEPNNATTQGMTWESSNSSVASVDNGTIVALEAGETDITVTTINNKTATCKVSVSEDDSDDEYAPDTSNDKIYFITKDTLSSGTYDEASDTYTFSLSNVTYEQIYVKAKDKKIVVELSNVSLSNSYNSPIYVSKCDSIDISAKNGTTNTITETRSVYTEDDNSLGKGAIFVYDGDLTLKGKGTLNITATYYNGIHGKDDVTIKNQTLNVTAPHHGIRGNDSLKIDSAKINVECGGDGLSTKNSDVSSKGKQRGDITLTGTSNVVVNSYGDAIAASHDINVESGTYTLKTNKYSSYDGPTIEVNENLFYIKMSSSIYSSGNYSYAAYINNQWHGATYEGTIKEEGGFKAGPGGGGGGPQPGGSTTYYVYSMERPENATSFVLYRFNGSNVTDYSTSSYNAKSDSRTFSSAGDLIQISSISSSKINFGSWSTYVDSPSTKGLKADNKITVTDGTFDIKALDDGIHVNSDTALENGLTPEGIIDIQGGNFTIYSDDDGVHADEDLNISGGNIIVTKAYEGIEATVINISGGYTKVNATNDGVNAGSGNKASAINISGGVLDVTVSPNGDTDGIDSNGTFTQTGGTVVTRGPSSTMAAALDTDGTARIDGGTIIVLGYLGEHGLTRGSAVSSYSLSLHSSGSHTINIGGESFTFDNSYSYSKTFCYSSVSVTA